MPPSQNIKGATGPVVLAFGDSLTAGYGLRAGECFGSRLETLLRRHHPGASVIRAGVSGETTDGGRARLPRVLSQLDPQPDLAIVELGANDFIRRVDPAVTEANLDWMIGELQRCGIPVLLAGMRVPAILGPLAARFNALFPAVAGRQGAALYPFFLDGVAGRRGLVLADGIHPNAAAIEEVARRILPHVEAALDAGARVAA